MSGRPSQRVPRRARAHWPAAARALALLLLVLGLAPSSCAGDARPDAWLETASSAHEAADEALSEGRLREARVQLEAILRMSPPPELAPADRRAVLQDVQFRLAEIGLLEGNPAEALQSADSGLALGRAGDLFTANLLLARGRALEELGRDEEAAAAYYEAIAIDDALLQERLAPEPPELTP